MRKSVTQRESGKWDNGGRERVGSKKIRMERRRRTASQRKKTVCKLNFII